MGGGGDGVSGRTRADVEVFDKKLKALDLAHLLAESEADVRTGRTRPARDFLKAFRRAKKISR